MPASHLSRRLYRYDACLLVAMSPGAALRFFPFAMRRLTLLRGSRTQVHAAPRRVHPVHGDAHWISEAQHRAAPLRVERGALLIEVPPVAAHPPHRHKALVALLPEGH